MDISNSVLIPSAAPESIRPADNIKRSEQKNTSQDQRLTQQDQGAQPKRLAAPEQLEQRSNEIQFSKVQRVNSLDSAPLRNQQAVNTYQQTVEAGRAYEEGELVGIDLFV